MMEIQQRQGFEEEGMVPPRFNLARVPNCAFANIRKSGIHRDYRPARAEIMSYLQALGFPENDEYGLVMNGKKVREFHIKEESRALTLMKENWKQGRQIFGFDAMQYGDITIPLRTVVLASGGEAVPMVALADDFATMSMIRRTEYFLVGEVVQGQCPMDPGGVQRESCLTITRLYCDTFPEDYLTPSFFQLPVGDEMITEASFCQLQAVEIIWEEILWLTLNLRRPWQALLDGISG